MARFFKCKVLLNFQLDDFDELDSMRDDIESYINNKADGSTFSLSYVEDEENETEFFARVEMDITATSRASVGAIFNQIDNNLPTLPDTVETNGKFYEYKFWEYEA